MKQSFGFTYVELAIVMSVLLILFTLSIGSISGITQKVSLNTSIDVLVTDIKEQQLKAMVGETEGRTTHDSYGIYFGAGYYTFFHGSIYSVSSPDNFKITLNDGIQINTVAFPGSTIIFSSGSGELSSFTAGANTFIMKQMTTGEQKTLTINRYGTISSIQ